MAVNRANGLAQTNFYDCWSFSGRRVTHGSPSIVKVSPLVHF